MDEGRLVGLMNIRTLNRIPREEWHNTSVQAAMLPRERIVWTSAGQLLLPLLERMVADDVHQVPVMNDGGSFAEVLGIVSRDSILRVIQAHFELRTLSSRSRPRYPRAGLQVQFNVGATPLGVASTMQAFNPLRLEPRRPIHTRAPDGRGPGQRNPRPSSSTPESSRVRQAPARPVSRDLRNMSLVRARG